MNFLDFENEKKELIFWLEKTKSKATYKEKLQIIDKHPNLQSFDEIFARVELGRFSIKEQFLIKALFVINQHKQIFSKKVVNIQLLKTLLLHLSELEAFCEPIGGLLGYQYLLLELASSKQERKEAFKFYLPEFVDFSRKEKLANKAALWGIEALAEIAELYPLGGAADRLHLEDPVTKKQLPAARLRFGHQTLLEYLIQDLEAREYLYFKLFGKKVLTPVAIMTSHEKDNHEHIRLLCEKKNWFGRPKESFRFFVQPVVPTITEKAMWVMKGPCEPLFKPGGHGVIWKLARDKKIFQWLKSWGRKKALVRQINNPVAGVDHGLLSFIGWGYKNNMQFGFSSCPRLVGSAEGINLLIEKKSKNYEYALSNIEYCDFQKYAICDESTSSKDNFSKFCSNTNILFVDLQAVEKASAKNPFPGLILNFKEAKFKNSKGSIQHQKLGRLESTMQNIADEFTETYSRPLVQGKRQLEKIYITYNHRYKTISSAKKVYQPGKSLLETPEQCFYDLLKNHHDLLSNYCGVDVPDLKTIEEYLSEGPSFLFFYLPALGPLYSILGKKIRNGKIEPSSELRLFIAELEMHNFYINGSLIVESEDLTSRCSLKNIVVQNQGIDWQRCGKAWKDELQRKETLRIFLHKNAEIEINGLKIEGNHFFEVPEGKKMVVYQEDEKIKKELFSIEKPSWSWDYQKKGDQLVVKKKSRQQKPFAASKVYFDSSPDPVIQL